MNYSATRTPDKIPQYMQATGQLPHPLTNDYMFKALLQKNESVLKHLICSLLHLHPEEVESVGIKNPIVLGEEITGDFDSKIFVLDINVLLNHLTLINLEMQVINYENWPERALIYLCRNFDQLSRGDDYTQIKPTIHIGFLDFTLFPEQPAEFYATNKIMNEKTHHIFSDKFALSVVDLKHIELATPEDREWKVDYWATLFKATTWEELKMLAEKSPILGNAAETIYELTADESIREQCKAREKQVREMNTLLKERENATKAKDMAVRELEAATHELEAAVQAKDRAVHELDAAIQAKDRAVHELDAAVQAKDRAVHELDAAVQAKDKAIQEKDAAVQAKDKAIQEKDAAVQAKDRAVQEKNEIIRQMELLQEEIKRLKELQPPV